MSPAQKKMKRRTAPKPLHHHLFGPIGNAVLAIAIVGSFAVSTYIARTQNVSPQMAAVISSSLVQMTNADRQDQSLATLTIDPKLTAAAQAKADDEAAKGYFAHTSPDGHTSWYWFQQSGYQYSYAGENLAVDFTNSSDVESAWLASPSHRANILNPHYTQIGIATAVGTYQGHKATFVVQMLGAPVGGAAVNQTASAESGAVLAQNTAPSQNAPTNGLRFFYLAITVAILITLVVRTRMELRVQHLRHAGVGAIALLSMLMLLLVADQFSYLAPLLPSVAASSVGS